MSRVWALFKKEMRIYFSSPIAYGVMTVFLVIGGYFFYSLLAFFSFLSFQVSSQPYMAERLNLSEMMVRPLFGNLSVVLLLLLPLITMRLFAEEKRSQTVELLFTYPIRDIEILLGKFLACAAMYLIMLASTGIYPLTLFLLGNPEPGPLGSAYLGIFLLGLAFISLGIFISSLTENQILAAVISFGALLILWVLGWAESFAGPQLGSVFKYLSIIEHFEDFTKGVVDTRHVVFYLLFSFFFLFLTLRSLESSRWRG